MLLGNLKIFWYSRHDSVWHTYELKDVYSGRGIWHWLWIVRSNVVIRQLEIIFPFVLEIFKLFFKKYMPRFIYFCMKYFWRLINRIRLFQRFSYLRKIYLKINKSNTTFSNTFNLYRYIVFIDCTYLGVEIQNRYKFVAVRNRSNFAKEDAIRNM